jgi:uncharacterized protein DUF4232
MLAVLLSSCTTSTARPQRPLASGRSSTPVTQAAARSTPAVDPGAGVIPWIDAPAPPYQPPEISTAPLPPADARPCTGTDVSARFQISNGANGHQGTSVQFRNVSDSICLLKGYPRVVATESGLADVAATSGSFFDFGHPANMAPGGTNLLVLETDTYCAARPGGGSGGPRYHRVSITLPGGGTVPLVLPRAEGFDVTCGLHVTRFFDPSYPEPEPVYPLAVLKVTLELPATVQAGATLSYIVDLTDPTAKHVSLDPCPGYVQALRQAPSTKATHALNCTPVGMIGPHQTVRFAMRLAIPADAAAGSVAVYWSVVPGGPTGAGTVVITR